MSSCYMGVCVCVFMHKRAHKHRICASIYLAKISKHRENYSSNKHARISNSSNKNYTLINEYALEWKKLEYRIFSICRLKRTHERRCKHVRNLYIYFHEIYCFWLFSPALFHIYWASPRDRKRRRRRRKNIHLAWRGLITQWRLLLLLQQILMQ